MMTPLEMPRVPRVLTHDAIMQCDNCCIFVTVKLGEMMPAHCECGEFMDESDCSKCNEVATHLVEVRQRIGQEAGAHNDDYQEPRCDKH